MHSLCASLPPAHSSVSLAQRPSPSLLPLPQAVAPGGQWLGCLSRPCPRSVYYTAGAHGQRHQPVSHRDERPLQAGGLRVLRTPAPLTGAGPWGTCGPHVCWGCKWKTEPAKGPSGCGKEPLIAMRGCLGSRGQQPSHGGSHSPLCASRVPTREGQTGLTADAPLHMAFLGCGTWPGPRRPLGSARGGFHGVQASHGGQATGSRIAPTLSPGPGGPL